MDCCDPCRPRVPKIKVLLDCEKEDLCAPLQPLITKWSIDYTFATPLNPTFAAEGLHTVHCKEVDSVSTRFLSLTRPPTTTDLEGSTISVPIPGQQFSTCSRCDPTIDHAHDKPCNVEVYFFGQGSDVGKYYAVLDAQFLESGNEIVCRVKQLISEVDLTLPISVSFVAVLRYLELDAPKAPITNTFVTPAAFESVD